VVKGFTPVPELVSFFGAYIKKYFGSDHYLEALENYSYDLNYSNY
jgi:hypothetical protein